MRPYWGVEGGGVHCVDISHSPEVRPCQSRDMWLQESPPALSSTPPIDFPSCRSVSLNHFIQGDPASPSPPDRLICALLAGFNRAMTFIHLSMYILPDCMVPSLINSQCTRGSMAPSNMYSMHATKQCSLSKKRNSVWIIFSPWP